MTGKQRLPTSENRNLDIERDGDFAIRELTGNRSKRCDRYVLERLRFKNAGQKGDVERRSESL